MVRVLKGLLEIFKVLTHAKDLVCKSSLSWDGGNIGSVLSPHEVSLMEVVEHRKKKGTGLLMMYITVLLPVKNTISRTRLRLGG
jgi:hypothetical protein